MARGGSDDATTNETGRESPAQAALGMEHATEIYDDNRQSGKKPLAQRRGGPGACAQRKNARCVGRK